MRPLRGLVLGHVAERGALDTPAFSPSASSALCGAKAMWRFCAAPSAAQRLPALWHEWSTDPPSWPTGCHCDAGARRIRACGRDAHLRGTDVDFGSLTRLYLQDLQRSGAGLRTGCEVNDLTRKSNGDWSVQSPVGAGANTVCVSWCWRRGLTAATKLRNSRSQGLCRVSCERAVVGVW